MNKSIAALQRALRKLKSLWNAGLYRQSLERVDDLLKDWPENPYLLVCRADLIQLQEEAGEPTLEEARALYERAAALAPDYPAPLIELGQFLYAVEDDAKSALKPLNQAVEECRRQLEEALSAKAKALDEIGQEKEAAACHFELLLLSLLRKKVEGLPGFDAFLEHVRPLARSG